MPIRVRLALALAVVAASMSAHAQDVGDAEAGRAFARDACASCHAIGAGQDRSPNPAAPGFARIAAVPGMTATALYVSLQTSHKTMPNLILDPEEMRNVVAFILSLGPRR